MCPSYLFSSQQGLRVVSEGVCCIFTRCSARLPSKVLNLFLAQVVVVRVACFDCIDWFSLPAFPCSVFVSPVSGAIW